MASFGFSLGDIALVGTCAYNVYKSCQNAGEAFATITADGGPNLKPFRLWLTLAYSQLVTIFTLDLDRRIEEPAVLPSAFVAHTARRT
jgi:hypothetical protein